jgi:YD repeat-containing protein
MKRSIQLVLFISCLQAACAQYYYKDIIASRQAEEKQQLYRSNKVRSVALSSTDARDEPEDGFVCEQHVENNFLTIITQSKSKFTPESYQTAAYDERGLLIRSVDTSRSYSTTSEYRHDEAGRLTRIINTSLQTDNQLQEVEEHQWIYDQQGRPTGMIKIKNAKDTTLFHFVIDEKGNVVEERAVHQRTPVPTVYYYYNARNQLTDIVRFNEAAKRLLPDYIFAYDEQGILESMIVVPQGSTDYQKWVYRYNEKGLKTQEICFSRKSELLGKISYHYNY